MKKAKWGTPEDLRTLLMEVVSWNSVTLSEGEQQFPIKLHAKLQGLDCFHDFPEHLSLHRTDLRRKFLTALYKHPDAKETVCLLSHFDTVSTEEYGDFEPLATQLEELTEVLLERKDELTEDAQRDLESGEYLFGRGAMDMKMGLVMHMALLEKASLEQWPINLLLLTVPDEEVNSAGMRSAVPVLLDLKQEYGLDFKLFLNSEPVFTQTPGDEKFYIYSGSIGKILPAALFYGKETHAGEPYSGITSPYIASFLTRKMEWNPEFQEVVKGETTPAPVTLQQKDLRLEYSTQTPYRSVALYNVFLMERTASQIIELFQETAEEAAKECNTRYREVCEKHNVEPVGEISVIKYQDLLQYAIDKFGSEFLEEVKAEVHEHEEWDDRERSFRITDKLMIRCQELAPAIVVLFAPPYYPSVNSTGDEIVESCVSLFKEKASEKYNLAVERIHYFNGICDLSYVNYPEESEGWTAFERNTPVWGDSYSIPFEQMKRLKAPVLNIGPYGKDAHKRTERLHIKSAFEQVPHLTEEMIRSLY